MLLDIAIPPRRSDGDESIGSFVRRRVGREAFERMAEPLLSGIYAGDADKLSLLSTFPRLRDIEREHRSVIRGAVAQKRQASARPRQPGAARTPFVSLRGGLSELIDALAERIPPDSIHRDAAVSSIQESAGGYRMSVDGRQFECDGVIVTAPANAAAAMLASLDRELSTELSRIEYVSSATISLAFNASEVADKQIGRGFVIPRAEGRTLTAVTWTSNKFGGRVPEGTALLRGFVGRSGNEEPAFMPDDELIALVRTELREILGITAEPTTARVYRWHNALPQYNLGHQERLTRIAERASHHPGLALTGAAYRGVGIPDVIRDAQDQAALLIDRLTAT